MLNNMLYQKQESAIFDCFNFYFWSYTQTNTNMLCMVMQFFHTEVGKNNL